ncbi:hypothetical protein [Streptomyces zaomyceticus]|uniref:hypothetical protein n=1 Tax=Streptomyces zaomyceticus TaxID=68286 RepID=UPI001672D18B|nr:hypothetical protein [Streptomyces zaomyceticus]GHG41907.1 hypothetical protein GCM10018791_70310 [Streptomyces zaomyceticus]
MPGGKRHGYFTFTDPSGNGYYNHSSRSSLTLRLVYDPFWTRQAHPSAGRADLLLLVRAGQYDRAERAA